MKIVNKALKEVKEKYPDINFDIEVGWKHKYRLNLIEQSIKIIKDSGDKEKLLYVISLYEYYKIFFNLGNLLKNNPILIEKEVKYHCHDFYNFLEDQVVDNSNRIITGIIGSIANDVPLDIFYKYLIRPDIYKEEFEKKRYKYEDEDEDEDEN